jgi:flagellar hook-length control protein FliK
MEQTQVAAQGGAHVNPGIVQLDPASLLSPRGAKSKATQGGGLFEILLNQLTNNRLAEPVAAVPAAPRRESIPPQDPRRGHLYEPPPRPVERLRRALEATGRPLESFQVPAADRRRLEQVLVASGYGREQAQEIIKRASQDDGSVNLGVMFALLPQYPATEGPCFELKLEDRPLLAQVLQELGVPAPEVNRFLESLPVQGDRILVWGLPRLLAQAQQWAEQVGEMPEVDADRLRELLARLGLNRQDIQTLLAQARDKQGRMTPRAALALLEQAAARQDAQVGRALQELAAHLRLRREEGQPPGDAQRLRAAVARLLEAAPARSGEGAPPAQAAAGNKVQGPAWQEAAAQAADTKQGLEEALAGEGLVRLVKAGAGSRAGEGAERSEEVDVAAPQAARTGAAVATARAVAGPQGGSQAEAQFTGQGGGESALAQAAAAQAGGAAGRAVVARGVLPPYVVRQVAQQMAQMVRRGQGSLRLTLKPPELGGVVLKLSVKHGVVRATLTTDSVAAKQVLEAGLEQLRQQLLQQGLKPERIEVLVNPDAQRQQARGEGGGQDQRRRSGQGGSGLSLGGEESEEEFAAAGVVRGEGRVNLFA